MSIQLDQTLDCNARTFQAGEDASAREWEPNAITNVQLKNTVERTRSTVRFGAETRVMNVKSSECGCRAEHTRTKTVRASW
uniref:Uncharacterized protein n=1 Tax=Hyaloperonospora arabidopsidis (strain Emoy2) TaxID=559515 RepID=M4BG17_HYAAE